MMVRQFLFAHALGVALVGCSDPIPVMDGGATTRDGGRVLDAGSTGDDATVGTDAGPDASPMVPDGLLFFDDFNYAVDRAAAEKFDPGQPFQAHGWSGGKDEVSQPDRSGGFLYTATAIPGFDGPFPGVDSSHVLCVESRPVTEVEPIEGGWQQTDFYLQYGDAVVGPLDTIPPDVWFQHWMYIADAGDQRSLFTPTNRLGKWIYPTRAGYPSHDLEWLWDISGIMTDSEHWEMGSSVERPIASTSLAWMVALSDDDLDIYTDDRAYALETLGHCGDDPEYQTVMTPNEWWLVRFHVDHTSAPGVFQQWIRRRGGDWIKVMDTATSPVIDWTPRNQTDGHRAFRMPTTISNWSNPEATTHGDFWIYLDDFAIARGVNAGGGGEADLPTYPY